STTPRTTSTRSTSSWRPTSTATAEPITTATTTPSRTDTDEDRAQDPRRVRAGRRDHRVPRGSRHPVRPHRQDLDVRRVRDPEEVGFPSRYLGPSRREEHRQPLLGVEGSPRRARRGTHLLVTREAPRRQARSSAAGGLFCIYAASLLS